MFTYGFTDFSNGSSAFGSISSQPTPLESSTSGFSNGGSPSIQLALDDSTTLETSTSEVSNNASPLSIQCEVGTIVPASSISSFPNNASPSIEPAVDSNTPGSSISDFSNNVGPSIQPEVGTIAPVSSFTATGSLGSVATEVAFGNVGSSAFGSTSSQPTPLESSACDFSDNGCPSIQSELVSTALASSTSDLSNNGGPSIQPELGTVAPASSTSDLLNNGSPSIEPAMDSTAPVSSTADLLNNGGLSIQPAVVDSPTPASSISRFSNNAGPGLSIQPAVGSITPTPVSPLADTTSLNIGGTKVAIGYAAFGNVGSSTVFGYPPSQPSPSGSSSSFCTTASPSIQHGSSLFGQKPAFGGFWSTTPSLSSPFGGSNFQQIQSAFGSIPFGSSAPFGAPSQHSFGTSSIPGFRVTSTPAFSAPTTAAFSAGTASAFGSQPTAAFGAATTSAFGSRPTATFGSGGVFGTPAFSSTSIPAFGATTAASTFGTSNTPFGAQPFSFVTSPAFGQTNSGFGSSPFGSTLSAFGAQSSTFGTQTTTPSTFGSPGAFGQPGFSVGQQQHGGSKVVAYAPTAETDDTGAQSSGKFESISAMPVYKEKSHEELRWEDCQLSDKGSSSVFGSCPSQTSPFESSSSFITTAANTETQHARGNVAPDPVASHGSWIIPPYASSGDRSWTPSRQAEPHPMLLSISAMPVYVDKSPEELRWIDYQVGDIGGWVQKHGIQLKCVPRTPFGNNISCNSAPAFGSAFTTSNQPPAWGNFQSSIFPPRGGFQSQSWISGSPSPASGFLRPTFGVPTASVFESSGFESATPYVRPRWGSRVASYTSTAEATGYPLSNAFEQINEPTMDKAKREGKELDASSSTYFPVPQDKNEGKPLDASSSTHCPEPQHKKQGKQTDKKKMQDVRKAVEVECSTRHCPEPRDKEHGKQTDKKKMQDLRKAVEVECEVERRVSVKHIAFLTSMLEKLDSLNI
ncbi:hypothetical protein C5167_018009 [Papaver somniferum]|uniref:Uncharacterized protein n=1 Tax=Papaver somniferum TaxID=3469 RepID=A0A4Y7IPE8_PAPSO|nr:nuclear pore complex protein NUP98A-like [Papaver somniferum]RZC49582.1 hypothetical protein C5167_018009 [Papaver somniferum]